MRAHDHALEVLVELPGLAEYGAELRGADEVWVTSSSKEIGAIVDLDGNPVGTGKPGPVFRKAWQLYQDFKSEVMRANKQARAA